MTETKSILASRTVWGAAIAVLASLAGLAGYAVGPADQAQALGLVDELVAVSDRLIAVAGGALAIWGRVRASKAIAR